jgi:hypothetical protein
MHEILYILTIIYAIYVIDAVIGEQIICFIKNVFHLDLSAKHANLRKIQDSIKNIFNSKSQTT